MQVNECILRRAREDDCVMDLAAREVDMTWRNDGTGFT